MLADQQTITVSTVPRTYEKTWDAEFAKEIAEGSTSVRKASLTDGNSILRVSHSESKGVERHLVSVRDKTQAAGEEDPTIVQAHVVLTCPADDPTEAANVVALAQGLLEEITASSNAILTAVVAGQS